jgi:hypothetical protein
MPKAPKWMMPVSRTATASGGGGISGSNFAPVAAAPPAAAGPLVGGSLDPLSSAIMIVNTNPYIIGLFMLLLNLGGRFLSLELTKKQEAFLQAPWIRPLLFFTVIFISTRNLIAAFWVTILFFFIIWIVANENSPYCMIPSWCDATKHADAGHTYMENVQKMSTSAATSAVM